jgi:hypothetical protein
MTLRETARQSVSEELTTAAQLGHETNYNKLHIYRDGTVSWTESINRSDDLIDSQAEGFCAIPSVITTGNGSISCNCDYCNEIGNEVDGVEYTAKDAIQDAVADSDLTDTLDMMLNNFDEIAIGYFDDETANEDEEVA